MTKHTEGPWEVERVNKADLRITAPSRHIAKLVRYGSAVEQNMDFGNAALIAAAPDMLEALKECVTQEGAFCFARDSKEYIKRLNAITEIAEAAINKAKGGE